jgi:deoxycytidylate deaminase
MYTQSLPCADCGRAIIQSGIKKIILHQPYELIFGHLYSTWKESCEVTKDMFLEAGIKVSYITDLIGVVGFIDGKRIEV